ncbi:MAG: cytidine deaminase [Theionarchaea archaeon]|nr:cytidine deaminase [Theionarchaea archaeon]MBU7036480.1 cytidine deaminase [Theionarchaea archaeon]
MNDQELMSAARKAVETSYSPYSMIQVGAALITKGNEVFTGCNVENVSYSLSMCAERIAVFTAVLHGMKPGELTKIAVAGKTSDGQWQSCPPCGACRQVIWEFAESPETPIIYQDREEVKSKSIGELLPDGFDLR